MRAMILKKQNTPLVLEDIPIPKPKEDEILIKVLCCGVCRTDLHIINGDLKHPNLPLVLGHQIVGIVEKVGYKVSGFNLGDRIGVPWLGSTCHICEYCQEQKENLCDKAKFTGYDVNGGFAEYTVCKKDFAYHLPASLTDENIAPILCAGLIGYRSYKKANAKKTIGMYGFGVAAHILTQLAVYEKKKVYAFTRPGDTKGQEFAKSLGAVWAAGSDEMPPEALDAAIIFAPIGDLVPQSLKALKKGGRCVCAGIHMSDIPSFPYKDLWGERSIESVANLTRKDGQEFLQLTEKTNIKTSINTYSLEDANQAVEDFKNSKLTGATVIKIQ